MGDLLQSQPRRETRLSPDDASAGDSPYVTPSGCFPAMFEEPAEECREAKGTVEQRRPEQQMTIYKTHAHVPVHIFFCSLGALDRGYYALSWLTIRRLL